MSAFIRSLRPKQWPKNGIIYFALVFTLPGRWDPQQPLDVLEPLGVTTAAFLLFCLLSSATYLVNDVVDAAQDRAHPLKQHRPIASGGLSAGVASVAAAAMMAGGAALSLLLTPWFGVVALLYLGLTLAYSLGLKRIPIVDVLALSAGYVLRAAAGAVVLDVPISPWLYMVTSLGAMLIGFGKRRNELVQSTSREGSGQQRRALEGYSVPLLDQLISAVTPATLISYILYTFTAENLPENHAMMLTIPFIAYGLFRYLLLVYQRNLGETPEDVLLTDRPIQATVVLWLATAVAVLIVAG
jgi:4-hydroxybenzoate polyprenyltransferase